MSSAKLRIGRYTEPSFSLEDLELVIGQIVEEKKPEKLGPTPFPSLIDLREWDRTLLKRYRPFYVPQAWAEYCILCTYGKCDFTGDKRSACGLNMPAQQARISALSSCLGAATHALHADHLVNYLIKKYGENLPIDLGGEIEIEAPIIRTVCGIRPRKLGDLKRVIEYVKEQLSEVLASLSTGQESSPIDFESKALHAGMLDNVALEVADIAQIAAYNFPKGDPNSPLVDIGLTVVDTSKPVILLVGHNVAAGVEVVDYLKVNKLDDKIEVCGICCTAHDIARYESRTKIIGNLSKQMKYIRSGIADVIILSEQCIRADLPYEASRVNTPIISVSEKHGYGFRNRTNDPVDEIVEDLVHKKEIGALILDLEKAAEVAVKVAMRISPLRQEYKKPPSPEHIVKIAETCTLCRACDKICPNNLPISDAIGNYAKKGDLSKLYEVHESCTGCMRCEFVCPVKIEILTLMEKTAEIKLKKSVFRLRAGRGPVLDTEIRRVGMPIVMGEIPGVIGFVGCPNYPASSKEIAEMCEEFLKRRYIVTASGCAAMDIAMYKDKDGKTLYEKYPGVFDAGGLTNVGSCVANSHIIGAAIKISSLFARRNLYANYEEIADYILNRIGAVAIAWGAATQKAYAIACGANRFGIPVIVGPHGIKYGRFYVGRKEETSDWMVYDARTGKKVYGAPAPEHLFYTVKTKEEAMVLAAKLCIRPNDTAKGRNIKLTHYVDFHKRFFGTLPDDIHLFIRNEQDIPITFKDEIMEILKERGWEPQELPDPTLLKRLVRVNVAQ